MFENYVHDGLYREVIHSNSPFIRGFAKLKKNAKNPEARYYGGACTA